MSIPMHDFHFIRPEWFWLVLPTLAVWLALFQIKKRQSGWQSVIAPHLYAQIISGSQQHVGAKRIHLLGIMWLCAIVAIAGPTWERLPQPVYQEQTGHVVLMDMSLSMRATDVKPDRLTRAKYKAIDLLDKLGSGEVGLVAYAGDAFAISPLTSDIRNITALIPSLSPEIMPTPGSDPVLGYEVATELLINAGYNAGFIHWITDGVDQGMAKEMQTLVNGSPFKLNILAVGTRDGAPVKLANGELLKQANGAIVIPKLNTGLLQGIARSAGGKYTPITNDDRDINYLGQISELDVQADTQVESEQNAGDQWQELGPYLLLALLPFAAFAFRRGILVVVLTVTAASVTLHSPVALAQQEAAGESPTIDALPWWKTPFLNRDQRALSDYQQGNFDAASRGFSDSQLKAASNYKLGDFESALEQFSQASDPTSLYNQGNSLAHLGRLQEAIESYQKAIEQQPDFQQAIENKAIVEKLLEQQNNEQQNDQQQDGENQEQGDQQQDNQQESGDSQSEQQENGEQQQNQQDQSDSQQQNSEQQQQSQQPQDQQQDSEQQSQEQQQQGDETEQVEQDEQQAEALTEEQKEQQQRMETLMRRIPDDPAFLLKRKMQLEAQQRRDTRAPTQRGTKW